MRAAYEIRSTTATTVAAIAGLACENEAAERFYTHIINGVADIRESHDMRIEDAFSDESNEVGDLFIKVVLGAASDDEDIRMQQLVGTRAYILDTETFSSRKENVRTMARFNLDEAAALVVQALGTLD